MTTTRSPLGDERRERVEHRRLAAARAAGDEDVELASDERLRAPTRDVVGERAEADEALDGERLLEEAADRDARPVGRGGREDRLDARAVGEAPFEDRLLLVDVLADELRRVAERRDERLARLELRAVVSSSWPFFST